MASTPGSTPYFSYEAFAGLKYYNPFYAQDFHPGGLCKWCAPPVLPRTSVMRLLRVWSIIPLFLHKISTQVVCVNGKCLCCLVLLFFRRNGRYLISVTADNAINRNEASIYIAIIDDPKWSAPEVTIYGPHKTSVSGNHKAAIVDQ